MPYRYRLALLCALGVTWSLHAKTVRFDMRDAMQRNLIQFVSDAPLEKTVGISNSLAGWLELDPDKLADGFRGEFEVDVRTFLTGIELKNEQVRDKFLGGGEFPLATYSMGKTSNVSKPRLVEGQPVTARVEGTLKVRGLARPQTILLRLLYYRESDLTRQRLSGNLLKVSATFDVDITQFNLSVPDSQRARLARFVQVAVDAIGSDQLPAVMPTPADGQKPKDARKP